MTREIRDQFFDRFLLTENSLNRPLRTAVVPEEKPQAPSLQGEVWRRIVEIEKRGFDNSQLFSEDIAFSAGKSNFSLKTIDHLLNQANSRHPGTIEIINPGVGLSLTYSYKRIIFKVLDNGELLADYQINPEGKWITEQVVCNDWNDFLITLSLLESMAKS